MSGHNKWSTIKNKKGKADAARGKIFTKIGRELAVAVKLGGSDGGTEAELVVTKSAQIEHVIPSEVRANCSATVRDTANGGFTALLLGLLGALGFAGLRRKREN